MTPPVLVVLPIPAAPLYGYNAQSGLRSATAHSVTAKPPCGCLRHHSQSRDANKGKGLTSVLLLLTITPVSGSQVFFDNNRIIAEHPKPIVMILGGIIDKISITSDFIFPAESHHFTDSTISISSKVDSPYVISTAKTPHFLGIVLVLFGVIQVTKIPSHTPSRIDYFQTDTTKGFDHFFDLLCCLYALKHKLDVIMSLFNLTRGVYIELMQGTNKARDF